MLVYCTIWLQHVWFGLSLELLHQHLFNLLFFFLVLIHSKMSLIYMYKHHTQIWSYIFPTLRLVFVSPFYITHSKQNIFLITIFVFYALIVSLTRHTLNPFIPVYNCYCFMLNVSSSCLNHARKSNWHF